jgi:hemolysin activation/secretion protein
LGRSILNAGAFLAPTVVLACLTGGTAAFAQVGGQPIPDQLLGQTREEVDPARQAPPVQAPTIDPAALAEARACPFAGQGRVTLSRIEVAGATLVPKDELDRAVTDLVGVDSDLGVLCTARDRIAHVYAQRGEALARVDLPEQRVSDGVLTLQVTEGRIVRTTLQKAEALGPASSLAAGYLGALETGGATSWPEVERAFLLTREIPGNEVNFSIRRAEDGGANGLEAVAAFAPRRKLDLSLSGQNFGSAQLDREGLSLRIDANSFTGLGERTSLVLFSTLEGTQRVFQLLEEVRVGREGLVLLGDVAYGETKPEGALAPLEIEGRSLVARLGFRYPVVRARAASLDLGGRFELIDQKNDLGFLRGPDGGPIPLFEENLRVLAAEASGRWQPVLYPGLVTGLNVELRKGLDMIGSSKAGDELLSRAEGRPDFTSLRFQIATRYNFWGLKPFGPYASLTSSAQWSPHALPAYEEFQVGNYTIGRGYDPGAASGDRAVAAQLEAGWEVPVAPAILTAFGFADVAKLWNEDSLGYDSRPWSFGAGFRARARFGQLSLVYAAPQTRPFPGAAKPADRLLVSFSTNYSIR